MDFEYSNQYSTIFHKLKTEIKNSKIQSLKKRTLFGLSINQRGGINAI